MAGRWRLGYVWDYRTAMLDRSWSNGSLWTWNWINWVVIFQIYSAHIYHLLRAWIMAILLQFEKSKDTTQNHNKNNNKMVRVVVIIVASKQTYLVLWQNLSAWMNRISCPHNALQLECMYLELPAYCSLHWTITMVAEMHIWNYIEEGHNVRINAVIFKCRATKSFN